MSRDYQSDRSSYDPFDNSYDSGFSGQSREYADLYNPNKSVWGYALKNKPAVNEAHPRFSEQGGRAKSLGQERALRQAGSNYHSLPQSEEEIFDSGYDVTKRNTYGYRTSGFGPRD